MSSSAAIYIAGSAAGVYDLVGNTASIPIPANSEQLIAYLALGIQQRAPCCLLTGYWISFDGTGADRVLVNLVRISTSGITGGIQDNSMSTFTPGVCGTNPSYRDIAKLHRTGSTFTGWTVSRYIESHYVPSSGGGFFQASEFKRSWFAFGALQQAESSNTYLGITVLSPVALNCHFGMQFAGTYT